MDYRNLSVETWKELSESGNRVAGYKSTWLALNDKEESDLHIFKDELGQYHLAIKTTDTENSTFEDPGVNGLQLGMFKYRFEDGEVNQFIDLKCNIVNYLEEFTEVVKEIAKGILINKEQPLSTVNQVIKSWISFWANQKKHILSEEAQIGLICELFILRTLCKINPKNALKSWTGPLGQKHDFNFADWNFEVKGTRKTGQIHTINGIDQLTPPLNKHLGFLSFLVSESNGDKAINLNTIIESIVKDFFNNKPDLIVHLNELLAAVGYSPIHAKEYFKFNIEINKATFFEVNNDFPKLTLEMINKPLSTRVSLIRYDISLEGIIGSDLNDINWGDYFY